MFSYQTKNAPSNKLQLDVKFFNEAEDLDPSIMQILNEKVRVQDRSKICR